MTRLEQIEHQLNHLLSQYAKRKDDPGYILRLSLLATKRNLLLKKDNTSDT